MRCPSCKTELVKRGQARTESLVEHCFDPNGSGSVKDKFVCPNEKCIVSKNSFWSQDGEYYCHDILVSYAHKKSRYFIDNNTSPFGSMWRKINVEAEKKDENYDLFTFGRFRFHKRYNYVANEDGEVIKRSWSLEIWEKRKGDETEHLYISGLRMFRHEIRMFHKERKFRTPRILTEKLNRDKWWNKAAYVYAYVFNKLFPVKLK